LTLGTIFSKVSRTISQRDLGPRKYTPVTFGKVSIWANDTLTAYNMQCQMEQKLVYDEEGKMLKDRALHCFRVLP
jgi:hypothetical protein